jgi:hypothetical protein
MGTDVETTGPTGPEGSDRAGTGTGKGVREHVSNHADEVGDTIAALAPRRCLAPRVTIALVVTPVPANRLIRTAGVEDSVICRVGDRGPHPARIYSRRARSR